MRAVIECFCLLSMRVPKAYTLMLGLLTWLVLWKKTRFNWNLILGKKMQEVFMRLSSEVLGTVWGCNNLWSSQELKWTVSAFTNISDCIHWVIAIMMMSHSGDSHLKVELLRSSRRALNVTDTYNTPMRKLDLRVAVSIRFHTVVGIIWIGPKLQPQAGCSATFAYTSRLQSLRQLANLHTDMLLMAHDGHQ